ncbi:MAG: glycosyltransferase family 4 protein [Candidatus Levybacteria bacterium CG10_big_fil_rev_8_21_14_0_10_35_13]|nr:MAG: glycosyltransferase family 4 protein [Candidatus Levybacteria bacterium CG10_big_fil_rev_8_21_14_0_10_35_13]
MRIALVYDRVNKWGGAERVLLALHEIFPDAPLYTAVYSSQKAKWAKLFSKVIPSFLQKIPLTSTNHEFLGIFTPIAFEAFNFEEYDLVISVTSEAAKGIITKPKTLHICYCLTPTRYLWSAHDFYFRNPPSKFKFIPHFWYLSRPFVKYLKYWDKIAAQRPDEYIAISSEVKKRIEKFYNRKSTIMFPPLMLSNVMPIKPKEKDYFLIVSRLVPYKKIDIAIKVFNELGFPLKIIGSGGEEKKLKKMANSNVEFLKNLSDEKLYGYYQNAKALIFPGVEDFGLSMVEAQYFGKPVVAFRGGGALDIVKEGVTGEFFNEQSVKSLKNVLEKFDHKLYNEKSCSENSQNFSFEHFRQELLRFIEKQKTI